MTERARPRFFYGWLIVGILALTMMLTYTVRSSFNIFYLAILDEFSWTRAETAGMFSVSLVFYGLGGLASGFLLDYLGPRKLFPISAIIITLGTIWCSQASSLWEFYIAFGVIIGFGQAALGYVPTMTVINHWFVKFRGLAAGIAMFGLSLSFVLNPLTEFLTETISWRTTFIIYGGILSIIVVPLTAFFLRLKPQDKDLLPDGQLKTEASELDTKQSRDLSIVDHSWTSIDWTLAKAFRTSRLWLLFSLAFMMGMAVNFPQVHHKAYVTDVGYSAQVAATTLALFGILNGIGPLGGFISDRIGRERTITLGAIFIIIGMIAAVLIRSNTVPWAWYVMVTTYGLSIGLLAPTLPAVYGDLFAGRNLGGIIGFINMGFGLGGAVGPLVAGYVYDLVENYTAAFLMILGGAIAIIIFIWIIAPRKVRLVAGKLPK